MVILFILPTWKDFVARVEEGLENYKSKFERLDTIK
jgi:hypothetical protein